MGQLRQGLGGGRESKAKGKGRHPHRRALTSPRCPAPAASLPPGKLSCLWLSPTPLCSARPG